MIKIIIRTLGVSLSILLIVIYGTTGLALAHVLKQDNGISGELHIPPDDHPVAGQPTQMDESFGDQQGFSLPDCDCQMAVKSQDKVIQTVALKPFFKGATLDSVTTVQFPSIGNYDVVVTGSAKDHKFPAFKLDYPVHVATAVKAKSSNSANNVLIIGIVCLGFVLAIAAIPRHRHRD